MANESIVLVQCPYNLGNDTATWSFWQWVWGKPLTPLPSMSFGMSLLAVPLNILAIFVILRTRKKHMASSTTLQSFNEASIHLILLAISDTLCASRAWLLLGYFYVDLHVTGWDKYDALFINTYVIVLSTSNCWMTFYVAIKRFRIIFDFEYARNWSTSAKIRSGVCKGFLFGFAQGEHERTLGCFQSE